MTALVDACREGAALATRAGLPKLARDLGQAAEVIGNPGLPTAALERELSATRAALAAAEDAARAASAALAAPACAAPAGLDAAQHLRFVIGERDDARAERDDIERMRAAVAAERDDLVDLVATLRADVAAARAERDAEVDARVAAQAAAVAAEDRATRLGAKLGALQETRKSATPRKPPKR